MDTKEYELILDSLDRTGIYVIREDNHQILYFNQKLKEILPEATTGVVCHELWQGSCSCCPLIGMGDKKTNRSFNPDGPYHKATDITATRVMWEGSVPAVVVTFSPHAEAHNSTYEKIVKGNLTTNTCEEVRMKKEERDRLPKEGFTLQMAYDSFVESGLLYHEDIKRWREFTDFARMREEFRKGRDCLVCNYRRNTLRGIRWNTMEVVPDVDYADDNQSIIIYVKDVQDIYREGLEHEALNVKNEAILKALGKDSFGIYLVELATGRMDCIKAADEDKEFLSGEGRDWESVLSWLIDNRYHIDYCDRLEEMFRLKALAKLGQGGQEKQELLLERKREGEWHYVSASTYYHKDTDGKEYAILAFKDVDSYIRREIGYAKNEKRLAAVIRSRYSRTDFVNLENGTCEQLDLLHSGLGAENENSTTGKYEDYLKRTLDTEVYEKDRKRVYEEFSLDSLRKKAYDVEDYREEIVQYRTINGEQPGWMEQHIFYLSQQDRVEVDILGRDITDQKRREEQESRSAQEKAHIINSLSSMFFSTGYINLESGILRRIVQRDDVAEVLSDELSYEETLQKYADHFVNPEDKETYLAAMGYRSILDNLSSEHPILACEYREIENDRWIRSSIVLSDMADGKPTAALYVAQDITESKQKEIADRAILQDALETANFANASKSEFLSRMSHDIRTPMNAIIGMTAIAGTHLDDKQRVSDCLGKITVSGRHLLSLINEVLDLSKIESGRVDLSEEEFDLSSFFDDLMTVILPSVHAKQQSLECKLYEIKHEKVVGDALRLQQVFTNILSNAVKYTPSCGKIEIEIHEMTSAVSGYGHYEFVFRDNGIGMSEEYVKRIFEPFSRDERRIGTIEGTGLGMAIARNIVQMMNGDITVESKQNEGSTFTVSVYLKIGDSGESVIKELVDLPVLVADDDEDACETACHVLNELGMKGEWVLTGKEAVERVETAHSAKKDYFAVILDWQMPGMDGIETARQIRAVVGPEVPIIILSAYDWADVEEEARAAGVNGFIAKPMFKSRLLYLFRQFINGGEEKESAGEELKDLGTHNYGGKRILLVEDNDLNREIAVEIIGMTGVAIECATNGKEAVEMFERSMPGHYDLIFMDIRMPVMDGYEATRAIRKLDRQEAKEIPIIAMSANAFTSDINASRQAGMNEHIIKPLNVKSLMKCMDKWLK